MTDLRIGQIAHGLGPRAFGGPATLLSVTVIINLKFAKLRRGVTSQFSLTRTKMQTSSADCQYSNITIILFATQYKN